MQKLSKLIKIIKVADGHKICIGRHIFVVICSYSIYCVYKRYTASVVKIGNIQC